MTTCEKFSVFDLIYLFYNFTVCISNKFTKYISND